MGIVNTNLEHWSDAYMEQRRKLMREEWKKRKFARYALADQLAASMPSNEDLPLNATLSVSKSDISKLSSGETLASSDEK